MWYYCCAISKFHTCKWINLWFPFLFPITFLCFISVWFPITTLFSVSFYWLLYCFKFASVFNNYELLNTNFCCKFIWLARVYIRPCSYQDMHQHYGLVKLFLTKTWWAIQPSVSAVLEVLRSAKGLYEKYNQNKPCFLATLGFHNVYCCKWTVDHASLHVLRLKSWWFLSYRHVDLK